MKAIMIIAMTFSLLFSAAGDRGLQRLREMQTESRYALVIGNNDYRGDYLTKLHNPINDARAIKKVLKARQFEVMYGENVTAREMKLKLIDFYKKIRNGGVGFFYFSGHGVEFDGKNYLIPVDATIREKMEVQVDSIEVGDITTQMKRANNRLNIVVLDACRNDPFSKGGSGGLSKMEPEGILVAYATGARQVASDGKAGENGLFTKHLIHYMQQKGLGLYDVFRETRAKVYFESRRKQRPAIYDQIIGQPFFFTLPDASDMTAPKTSKSRKQSTFSFSDDKPATFALTVTTEPSDAAVYITNIVPKYRDGIALAPGRYDIKVVRSGYYTKTGSVDLQSDLSVKVVLQQAATASQQKEQDHGGYIEPAMVYIKPGSFEMGSNGGDGDEKPVHTVNIGYGFYLGKTEVTKAEFQRFADATGYRTDAEKGEGCYVDKTGNGDFGYKSGTSWKDPNFSQNDNHPVVCVSHNDAMAYAKWLSTKTGQKYRLPTEAEWEYAARAGSTTIYSFGNDGDDLCRYGNVADKTAKRKYSGWTIADCDDSYVYAAPVGKFKPNGFGLHDIHGNVWEWCADWYSDSYSNTPIDGSDNKNGDQKYRVLRGGSWNNKPDNLRSANRNRKTPDDRNSNNGYRLARDRLCPSRAAPVPTREHACLSAVSTRKRYVCPERTLCAPGIIERCAVLSPYVWYLYFPHSQAPESVKESAKQ